jgi:hypothetical protein
MIPDLGPISFLIYEDWQDQSRVMVSGLNGLYPTSMVGCDRDEALLILI